ncbi:MFS transporter [Pedobacter arcticus]|uniref:MFS transporter n=1 Tax=Pedobacter arcticus TaxID=752140 RepID=UPI0002F0B092|nr:MFS transporter [Pedobacter arcticus]
MVPDSEQIKLTEKAVFTNTTVPKSYKWELLVLLWLAFFFNQADRQIFSVVMPLIREDLSLTDAELGLISSVLVWTYGLLVPLAGFVGDKFSKKKIIAFSLFIWSTATLLTGICTTLVQFILLRGVATGGGEAFYAPPANALLSDHHKKTRSIALSIHQTSVYAGIILSGFIAGFIAERYGWQKAFYCFGFLGVALAVVIFKRLANDIPIVIVKTHPFKETLKEIIKKPSVILLTLGFACMVFVNVGYLTWMPSFLTEKFHLSLSNAGFSSMFYHHIGALGGVILGGSVSDKLAFKNPVFRLVIQAVALLCGAPFIYFLGIAQTETLMYVSLFLFGFFRGIYDSNIFASLYELVKPHIRSSASGIMLMFAFLTGAFSPYLLGVLKPTLGLATGISWLWVSYFLGAIFITIAAMFFFKKDRIYTYS